MAHGERFDRVDGRGRSLAAPGRFTGDDGSPDLAIRDATDPMALLDALRAGRVLVAVVAVADDGGEFNDLSVGKSSEMAVVSMVAKDGRRGLLAFSGLDALRAWDTSARPVPVTGVDVAQAAMDDDCEAIVLDVAGPRTQVVPESDVIALTGASLLDHARQVAQRHYDAIFGDQAVQVTKTDDRLRIYSSIDGQVVADSVSPRILALVPTGIEFIEI